MVRSIAVLVAAISMSRPGIPKSEAARYAATLNETAKKYDFDPLTAVAIIHFESRWLPNEISGDGEDYGLGQVRGRWMSACAADADPVGAPSESCRAAKASLLDGSTNIRRMATIIAANRELCREKTGTAKAFQWLAGYQGRNHPAEDLWCQPGDKTWRVLTYREELIAKLYPKPKKPVIAAPRVATPKPKTVAQHRPAAKPKTTRRRGQ